MYRHVRAKSTADSGPAAIKISCSTSSGTSKIVVVIGTCISHSERINDGQEEKQKTQKEAVPIFVLFSVTTKNELENKHTAHFEIAFCLPRNHALSFCSEAHAQHMHCDRHHRPAHTHFDPQAHCPLLAASSAALHQMGHKTKQQQQ
jgi:hypothetical protein